MPLEDEKDKKVIITRTAKFAARSFLVGYGSVSKRLEIGREARLKDETIGRGISVHPLQDT